MPEEQDKPKRCGQPFRPAAGCTVATQEVAHEAVLAISTFQHHHNNVPVHVMADAGAAAHLKATKFDGPVIVRTDRLTVPSTVKKHNSYHRPDAILWKMNIFDQAVQEHGDAVFFDSDIVFFAPLDGPEDCEVALSHNLAQMPADRNGQMYGFFNAGLVWTCNAKYPNWWKASYLRGEGFYEQAGMNMSPRVFRCGYFDSRHNYGFWRGRLESRCMKSLHLHLNTNLDHKMPSFMVKSSRELRKEVWLKTGRQRPKVAAQMRQVLGLPRKMFFIHYGKAAGVYVNNIMVQQMTSGFQIYDSWRKDLRRDWSPEELDRILTLNNPEQSFYLHQHHMNVSREQVIKANEQGWLTFTFLRQPMDLICSLFYWREGVIKKDGRDPVLFEREEYNMRLMPISEFWYIIINDYKHLWMLPDYIKEVQEVNVFSEENFTDFCNRRLGYAYEPSDRENTSSNPGFEQCRAQGLISDHMVFDLSIKPEYRDFVQFLTERSDKDLSLSGVENYDVAPILVHPPHLISTNVFAGDILRCTPGEWQSASELQTSYRWYYKTGQFEAIDFHGAEPILDANRDFYVTSDGDVGKAIFCVVTVKSLHGSSHAFSSQSASVYNDATSSESL